MDFYHLTLVAAICRLHRLRMCQDDGPGASTVLGASWMMHQATICTAICCYMLLHAATCGNMLQHAATPHSDVSNSFTFLRFNTACHGIPLHIMACTISQDVIFDMPQQMVGSRRVAVSFSFSDLCFLLCQCARLKCK